MTTRRPFGTGFASLILGFFTACGGSPSDLRTLTEADVTGMVAGNAKGTTFAGTYVVDSAAITGCRCRTGSCRDVSAQAGGVVDVEQQDGAFTLRGCQGGVNEDGAFWCGGSAREVDIELTVNTGKFTVVAGTPTRMDVEAETTFVTTFGPPSDCDFQMRASARFIGRP